MVYLQAEFIGDKTGLWKLPPFCLELLAAKSYFVSGLTENRTMSKQGGYCPEIKGPEDWDFWISMLKIWRESSQNSEVFLLSDSSRVQNELPSGIRKREYRFNE